VTGQFSEEDKEASLSSFDDYYDLMLKVNPRFAKEKFLQAFVFPSGDPLTGNLALQTNEIQMEVLLAFVRNLIGANGVQDFFKLIEIFCNQEPYSDIGVSLLGIIAQTLCNALCSYCYSYLSCQRRSWRAFCLLL